MNYRTLTEILSLSSQKYRFGILERKKPSPDPGSKVKKAPQPGSRVRIATLLSGPWILAQKIGLEQTASLSVLGISNRMIRMFLGLPDLHPDPLVASTDPAPDPNIIKQK